MGDLSDLKAISRDMLREMEVDYFENARTRSVDDGIKARKKIVLRALQRAFDKGYEKAAREVQPDIQGFKMRVKEVGSNA